MSAQADVSARPETSNLIRTTKVAKRIIPSQPRRRNANSLSLSLNKKQRRRPSPNRCRRCDSTRRELLSRLRPPRKEGISSSGRCRSRLGRVSWMLLVKDLHPLTAGLIQDRKNSNGLIGKPVTVAPQRPAPVPVSQEVSSRLERQNSEPAIHGMGQLARRNNILGSGFLRPLTRVPTQTEALVRAKSSANISASNSPQEPTAQPMARSSTDGEGTSRAAGRNAQAEYAKRHPDLHQNWRAHGW